MLATSLILQAILNILKVLHNLIAQYKCLIRVKKNINTHTKITSAKNEFNLKKYITLKALTFN